MPIDPDRVMAASIPDTTHTWEPDDVILYHLGVGAGNPPTAPRELAYAYEAGLQVLPSFATIPMFGSMMSALSIDGLELNPMMILHGEHVIELHRPIPIAATVTNRARITGIHDKGKGAVIVVEVVTADPSDGPLFTNRASLYVRGEGGFGGEPGTQPVDPPPEREPDHTIESPTLPQQALLYRLSGDKNPLHADPAVAALAGFDRPILHGLCSYGIVCKALVDTVFDGDVTGVGHFGARFSGVVFPGEALVTRVWEHHDRWVLEAVTADRESTVISNASIARNA